jgi:hypothetical protein
LSNDKQLSTLTRANMGSKKNIPEDDQSIKSDNNDDLFEIFNCINILTLKKYRLILRKSEKGLPSLMN